MHCKDAVYSSSVPWTGLTEREKKIECHVCQGSLLDVAMGGMMVTWGTAGSMIKPINMITIKQLKTKINTGYQKQHYTGRFIRVTTEYDHGWTSFCPYWHLYWYLLIYYRHMEAHRCWAVLTQHYTRIRLKLN